MHKIGVDIGGTFTDLVLVDSDGRTRIAKSASTPENQAAGVMNVLGVVAQDLGLSRAQLLADTDAFIHGCTVATNTMVERTGVKTGLITSIGHEDTIIIGRVQQKIAGLPERAKTHTSRLAKADPPLVPRDLIRGAVERVDYKGQVIVSLNLKHAEEAIDSLVAEGVQALAVCLLWSFLYPQHEQAIRDLAVRKYPHLFVSISSDLSPVLGEYERTVTTVINSYVGPRVIRYVNQLEDDLRGEGYRYPLLFVKAGGGVTTTEEVRTRPIQILDSGPVGGTLGSRYLGEAIQRRNIIATDVGGTTFDVSLVHEGELQYEDEPVLDKYNFQLPKVLIQSIGAGGGSIAWLDQAGVLHVGPRSAGAVPGPACYGYGGERPTVTDANLLLGYLRDSMVGGRMQLDRSKAEEVIGRLAAEMGVDTITAANGIFKIMNAQMADLIRRVTVERGHDPRDFVLVGFGGAGPTHAVYYARDIGVKEIYVPAYSTAFSAFGMLTAPIMHAAEASLPMRSPLNAEKLGRLNELFRGLEGDVLAQFRREDIAPPAVTLQRAARIRYPMQVHELLIPLPDRDYREEDVAEIARLFEEKYTAIYGEGSALSWAGIELLSFRVTGYHQAFALSLSEQREGRGAARPATGSRRAYFEEAGGFVDTPVYDGGALGAGAELTGPCLVERMGDTVLIPPGYRGTVDVYQNVLIQVAKGGAE